MADMRATKEWAELEKILAEFERLELGSEAMGLATNFANQGGWLGPGPCHGMACPARLGLTLWCVGCALRRGWHSSGTVSFVCGMLATDSYSQRGRRSQCEILLDSILLVRLSPEAWGGSRFATANPRGKPGSAIRGYSGIALLSAAWQVKDLDISSELMRKGESLLQQFQRSSSGAKLKEEVPRVPRG